MALNYDFDVLAAAPDGTASQSPDATGRPMALFRDPATLAALGRAPQAVRNYLRAANFGINTYHSGAPAGRYPEADETARIAVIEALAENVARFDLPPSSDIQPQDDDFHLPAFFAAVVEAEPIAMDQVAVSDIRLIEPDRDAGDADAGDTLITAMADDPVTAQIDPAPTAQADADTPPPAPIRLQLPVLPRWVTAGAAFTVLGVAFGTALI